MKVELNTWQIAMLETLVQREINNFPENKESPYVRSLGGLLNILTAAKPRAMAKSFNQTAEAMKDTHIPRREGER